MKVVPFLIQAWMLLVRGYQNRSRLQAALGVGSPDPQGRRTWGITVNKKNNKVIIRRWAKIPPVDVRYV